MDPRPEEGSSSPTRELATPLLVLLAAGSLSAGRLARGTPLDGLSLALHLVSSLAALRMVHPVWRMLRRGPEGELEGWVPTHMEREGAEEGASSARVSPADVFASYRADPAGQPGARALPAGRTWLLSGPYAGVVFALLLAVHALAVPLLRTPLTLALIPVACGPLLLWWWRGRALRAARGGVAVLLTPSQLIVRDAVGARSAPWTEVQAVRVESKPAWDMLRGARRAPALLIARRGSAPILLQEDELGIPVTRALALVEHYRSAALGSSTPASLPE